MPRLLAILHEDGWALVREGATIFFVRPPFRSPETALADAVSLHGYEAQPDAPAESWTCTVERIRQIMTGERERASLPTNDELLARMLRSGPLSVLTGLLDKINDDWLVNGDLPTVEHALKTLLTEDRVKNSEALLERVRALHQRLEYLRDKSEL